MTRLQRPFGTCIVSLYLVIVLVLLLEWSTTSLAATLVCHDPPSVGSSSVDVDSSGDVDKNDATQAQPQQQRSCVWEVSWEEVARAWNAHDCVPKDSGDGITCRLHGSLDYSDPMAVPTTTTTTTTTDAEATTSTTTSSSTSSSTKQRVQACTEDKGTCITMETVTEMAITTTTTSTGLHDNTDTVTLTTAETKLNVELGENSVDAAAGHPTEFEASIPLAATVTNHHQDEHKKPLESGIRIGNYVYKEPWDQYAPPLARILKARQHLWRHTPPLDPNMEYALASAHLDIGMSHVAALLDEEQSPGIYMSYSMDSLNLNLAIQAYQHGEAIFHGLLKIYEGTDQEPVVHSSLAALHMQWGEVYQSPHYYMDDSSNDSTEMSEQEAALNFNDMALHHYEKSEFHYKQSMQQNSEGEEEADDESIIDTHISLAHVSHRIGRCHLNSIPTSNFASVHDLDLDAVMKGDSAAAGTLSESLPQLDRLLKVVAKAEERFQASMTLYRAAIQANQKDLEFQARLKQYLATTLQDAGTAAAYAGNLAKAIELQEEGVALCQEILDLLPEADRFVMIQYVGDGLYGLAGNYMQLGRYDETNAKYEAAMEWYEQHELDATNIVAGFEVLDDTLEAYEKQLSDYHELLREINMPDGYPEDQAMYGPNDAYEADLHAALGSAHLSRRETLMAIDHFKEAIRLYENDESGENLDRFIADTKMSLAAAYFTDGQFRQSAELHQEAMDIYQQTVGEGKNPMLAGLAEKLGMSIEDLGQINAFGAGAELLASQEIHDMIAGLDLDENSIATLQSLIGGKKKQQDTQNSQASETATTHHAKEPTGSDDNGKKATPQTVHQELIDLDTLEKVRKSALNSTSATEEL